MDKISSIIKALISEGYIPKDGRFEITENLLRAYFITYDYLFSVGIGTRTSSNTKLARRLAGLNLLRENIKRGTKANEIKAGHIYLISNPAFPLHYKIGASYDVEKRLAQYQTYSPYRDFKIEKYDFVIDKFKTESILLNHALIDRASGEWVSKENAIAIFDDLSRIHTSSY